MKNSGLGPILWMPTKIKLFLSITCWDYIILELCCYILLGFLFLNFLLFSFLFFFPVLNFLNEELLQAFV